MQGIGLIQIKQMKISTQDMLVEYLTKLLTTNEFKYALKKVDLFPLKPWT